MSQEKNHIRKLICLYIHHQDKKAFKEFYDLYYPKLIYFARIFLKDFSSAQEVVSDVFYKILKNPKLLEQSGDIDNYLFFSVKNQALTYLKKIKLFHSHRSVEDVNDYLISEKSTPEEIFIDNELYGIVRKEIEEMPPKRRAIYMMIKEDGLKYKEVAELLDISVKTVEAHMYQAIKPIRKAVREYLAGKDVNVKQLSSNKRFILFFL